jgi:hypothetical protein
VNLPGSEGICATPDGRHVLVATPAQLPGAGSLLFYRADTFDQLGEVPAGAVGITITSSPDGALAYVTSDSVTVVDVERRAVCHPVKGLGGAGGLVHLSD